MKRDIPPELYDEVFILAADIAQPEALPLDAVDETRASIAYSKLLALFKQREQSGNSDPFLTEALADFTDEKSEAIRLYELALNQCSDFPGEATLSKRIGLARVLIECGRTDEALSQIEVGRREALEEHDSDALKELEELYASCSAQS
jgi:hypothetical protein